MRTSIRNLLLSISLINFFGAAAFCAQAQVRKAEPEPLLLGSGSGTITISKANGQTVATETQFFPFSTGEYYTGAVRIKRNPGVRSNDLLDVASSRQEGIMADSSLQEA